MNNSAILVIERHSAPMPFDENLPAPYPVKHSRAVQWSFQSYRRFTERYCQPQQCYLWLSVRDAFAGFLNEIASLGLPLTLIVEEDVSQIRRATTLMAEYSNICGMVLTPFDEKECARQMEKMRNSSMASLFLDALESAILPKSPRSDEKFDYACALYAEAQNQYTELCCTGSEKHLFLKTLGSLCKEIADQTPLGRTPALIRVHDKYAVNHAHVVAVRPSESKRDYVLTLSNGKEIKMSRTHKDRLAALPVKVKRLRGGTRKSREKSK